MPRKVVVQICPLPAVCTALITSWKSADPSLRCARWMPLQVTSDGRIDVAAQAVGVSGTSGRLLLR